VEVVICEDRAEVVCLRVGRRCHRHGVRACEETVGVLPVRSQGAACACIASVWGRMNCSDASAALVSEA
jgi:hypothetical protein